MIDFTIGVACGMGLLTFLSWWTARMEWEARRKIDLRLKNLERHLCCGKGVFGCSGGPNCTWSHK